MVVQIPMHVREPGQPCPIHAYTVYTTIGGKGRCHTRGVSEESVVCRRGSTQVRESTMALKTMADVTGSPKQIYQWPHKKDLSPAKNFKKMKKNYFLIFQPQADCGTCYY